MWEHTERWREQMKSGKDNVDIDARTSEHDNERPPYAAMCFSEHDRWRFASERFALQSEGARPPYSAVPTYFVILITSTVVVPRKKRRSTVVCHTDCAQSFLVSTSQAKSATRKVKDPSYMSYTQGHRGEYPPRGMEGTLSANPDDLSKYSRRIARKPKKENQMY